MMRDQPTGGHIFNMDGAGGRSRLSPLLTAAQKRPVCQLLCLPVTHSWAALLSCCNCGRSAAAAA